MPTRVPPNLSLTPELQRLIESKVASGRYRSADEVVRAGLRLLETERETAAGRVEPKGGAHEDERLRTLAENLPGGMAYQIVVEADGARRFRFVSDSVEMLFGVAAADVLRDAATLYERIPEDHRARVAEAEAEALDTLSPFSTEMPLRLADGRIGWFRVSSRPRRMADGTVVWEGIALDITERRAAEERLRESEQRLAIAARAADLGIWDWDLTTNAMVYSERAKAIYGFPPDRPVTFEQVRDATHPDDLPRTSSITRRVLDPAIRAKGIYEYRIVRPDGTVRWVVAHGEAVFAGVGAGGHAVRFIGTIQDVTERKQADEVLRESEARLRLAIEAGRMAVWAYDAATDSLQGSPELYRLLGFPEDARPSAEEMRARYHPDDRECVRAAAVAALAHGRRFFQAEYRYLWPDGSVRWLMLRAEIRFGAEQEPTGVVGVVLDITDRKEAERALQESEARTREILETTTDAFYALDRDGRFVFANRRALEIWGKSAEDVLGRPFLDIFPQAAGSHWLEQHARVRRERRPVHLETVSPVFRRWISAGIYPSASGGLVISFRDISDRKAAEEEQKRLSEVVRQTPDFVGIADAALRPVFLNEAGRRMTGLEGRNVAELSIADWFHPDDRDFVRETVLPTVLRDGQWHGELRMRRSPDGTGFPAEQRVFAVRDADRLIGLAVIASDVTERRAAEARLRESEARFRNMADSAPALIWMTDVSGRVTFANMHFDHVFGRPAAEMLGDGWSRRIHPDDLEAFRDEFQAAFAARRPFRREARAFDKDREIRWFRCDGVARLSDAGEFLGYTGCAVDVTEAKRAEDHLRLLVNELNHRVKNTLTTVQALARQTLRPAEAPERNYENFLARLLALSQAHDVLTRENWEGADIDEVVARAIDIHRTSDADRFRIEGEPVRLSPRIALALAMALHELATNAVKYGALSTEAGRVEIVWRLASAPDGERLRLTWSERGGPAVEPPRREGFGRRLIERGLANDLGGSVELRFEPPGLTCVIEAPLRDLSRRG